MKQTKTVKGYMYRRFCPPLNQYIEYFCEVDSWDDAIAKMLMVDPCNVDVSSVFLESR